MKIPGFIKNSLIVFTVSFLLAGCTPKAVEDANYKNGLLHLEKYEYSSALSEFKISINSNPSNTDSYVKAADILIQKKQYDEAISILQNGKDFVSDPKLVYAALGQVFYLKNDYVQAEENYDKALGYDSNYLKARRGSAESKILMGKYEDAENKISDFSGGSGEDKVEAKYLLAGLQSKDFTKAKETIDSLGVNLEDYPELNRLNSAVVSAQESEENNVIEDYMNVAYVLIDAGDYVFALPILDEVNKENEYYYGGHMYTGYVYLKVGEYEKAKTSLLKALSLDSKNIDVLKFLAQTYEKLGDQANTLETYKSLISSFPKDGEVRQNYIESLMNFSLFEGAKEQCQPLLDIDSSIDSELLVSRVYIEIEDYSAADELLKKAIASDEYTEAEDQVKAEVLALSGWVKYKLGDKAGGLEGLQQSLSLSVSLPVSHLYIGVVYSETGQGVDAKEHLEKAIDLDFEGAVSAKAQTYLEKLN